MSEGAMEDRAAALRDEFDLAFARVPAVHAVEADSVLVIRIGGERHAIPLSSIAGLFSGKSITWVPSPAPELLGVAGFRGAVQPVYDLAMLLGYPKAASPRWIVITATHAVGLAFEGFDGFFSAAQDSLATYPVVDVKSVIEKVARRAAHDGGI